MQLILTTYLRYTILGICILLLCPANGIAQDSLRTLPTDSSEIQVRTAEQAFVDSIARDEAFVYSQAEDPESLWSRIQRWIFQTLFAAFQNPWIRYFFKISFFLIFGLVLLGLINQLLNGNIKSAFSGVKSTQAVSLNTQSEAIQKADLDKLLSNALSRKGYNDAVRILYLKALNTLNEHGLIAWKADKTNHDYLNELKAHASYPLFSRLTRFYEYVEYGDFSVEEENFESIRELYQRFEQQAGEDG